MALVILRAVFVAVWGYLAWRFAQSNLVESPNSALPWLGFLGVMLIAAGVLWSDVLVKRKRLDIITAIYFGLIIGLFLSYVLQLALTPLLAQIETWLAEWLSLGLATVLCYLCISVLLQTKDDFRFIIPYVEFAKEIKGLKPLVLDTSVVIDGRIADVVETRAIDNQLIMPSFVIQELQSIADSSDKLKRGRGRRGLDILNRLRSDARVDLQIFDRELPNSPDSRSISNWCCWPSISMAKSLPTITT